MTQEQETAYRQGYVQGVEEASRLVIQLQELGYKPTEIKRLLAVYDDHFLAVWRQGDFDKRDAPRRSTSLSAKRFSPALLVMTG